MNWKDKYFMFSPRERTSLNDDIGNHPSSRSRASYETTCLNMTDDAQEFSLAFVYGIEYTADIDSIIGDIQDRILSYVATAVLSCSAEQQQTWNLRRDEVIAPLGGVFKVCYPPDARTSSISESFFSQILGHH